MTTDDHLKRLCQSIADELTAGPTVQWCREHGYELEAEDPEDEDFDPENLDCYVNPPSAADWVGEVYDIQYVVTRNLDYIGARLMTAGGGPTVWVDLQHNEVVGSWWGEAIRVSFADGWNLDDYMSEDWESSRPR